MYGTWARAYGRKLEARPRGMAPCGCPVHPGARPPVRPDAAVVDFERKRCEGNASERVWLKAHNGVSSDLRNLVVHAQRAGPLFQASR